MVLEYIIQTVVQRKYLLLAVICQVPVTMEELLMHIGRFIGAQPLMGMELLRVDHLAPQFLTKTKELLANYLEVHQFVRIQVHLTMSMESSLPTGIVMAVQLDPS